jgi:acetoin:2,6-dichlorophenolindophenol oxidoreductase subunit alpha
MTSTSPPPPTSSALTLDPDVLVGWYRQMFLIRRIEERLSAASLEGELPGPVHVSIGQEAIAVGVCATLRGDDWLASTHRGHAHFLARGGEPRALVAEVFGRVTGACRGRGGSMHVADMSKGILGAQGIVGAGIGLATGAALTERMRGAGAVAVAFFGDGGANQGVLLESLNLAAVWKLPLILVCENNGWSEFTPAEAMTAGRIADRALPMGVPSASVDGNDIRAVYEATGEAVDRARRGDGPTLLEMRTYRTRGHVETETTFLAAPYRDEEEVVRWRERDPISLLTGVLADLGIADDSLQGLRSEIDGAVADAFAFALASPFPDPADALSGAYATAIG